MVWELVAVKGDESNANATTSKVEDVFADMFKVEILVGNMWKIFQLYSLHS